MLLALIAFYRAALPELANQALFGAVNVPPLVGGIALTASGERIVVEIGLLLQLIALLGATYSATTYRVLDIRRTVRQATVVGILTLVMALGAFGVGVLALHIELPAPQRYALTAALALAMAALVNPLYTLIARGLAGSLSERSASTSQQLRRFSADISGVVDLDELVDLTLRTVRVLLRARRGEFLLVSHAGKGVLEVEPAPRRGEPTPRRGKLAIESPITQRFLRARAPLLQYDLDFSPDFAAVPPAERAFFSQTRMSAYAPIVVQNRLIGIVCCGPKISDDPFTAADLEILMTIANQTGVALRSARLISDLRRREAEQKTLNRALSAAKEQLEKLDSVKSDFITIASHELRTPLAQIRGYAELMESMNEDGQLDQDQIASMTASISRAADRLEELIAAMLDVSQLDIDAMNLQFAPVRLEAAMRAALEPLVDAVRQRKLMVSARNLRDLPTIMADETRLVQAFRNIILNAIKYTPDGGRIDIRGEARENEIVIAISDTGIGIDPSVQTLIFEKFFRAQDPNYHSTGTTKFMGAGPGLGLTIARGVVMAHGGRIWVESPGYDPEHCPGSTFYVLLPLTPPDLAHRLDDLQKAVRLGERAVRPTPPFVTPPFSSTPTSTDQPTPVPR
jgi:signal transduction histidine kinase